MLIRYLKSLIALEPPSEDPPNAVAVELVERPLDENDSVQLCGSHEFTRFAEMSQALGYLQLYRTDPVTELTAVLGPPVGYLERGNRPIAIWSYRVDGRTLTVTAGEVLGVQTAVQRRVPPVGTSEADPHDHQHADVLLVRLRTGLMQMVFPEEGPRMAPYNPLHLPRRTAPPVYRET